ncbi:hypothetical protein Slin15195_G018390 [Septoria linicola]|uniref:Uncharacterized protein n=1 Tax=Septoria linicola TaxID=215465 RepID=A0A9Q9AL97_9PEZI|nr:hypothetical protein Slin15195_G018390 [Septoria linicola]
MIPHNIPTASAPTEHSPATSLFTTAIATLQNLLSLSPFPTTPQPLLTTLDAYDSALSLWYTPARDSIANFRDRNILVHLSSAYSRAVAEGAAIPAQIPVHAEEVFPVSPSRETMRLLQEEIFRVWKG